jgi:hypothetical protein
MLTHLLTEAWIAWQRWLLFDEPIKDKKIRKMITKHRRSDYSNRGIGLGIFIPTATDATVPDLASSTSDSTEPTDTNKSVESVDIAEYDEEDEDKENRNPYLLSQPHGLPDDVLEDLGYSTTASAISDDTLDDQSPHPDEDDEDDEQVDTFYTTDTIIFISPGTDTGTSPISVELELEIEDSLISPALHSSPEVYHSSAVIKSGHKEVCRIPSPEIFGVLPVKGQFHEVSYASFKSFF